MHDLVPILTAAAAASFGVIVAVLRARRSDISRHPYRDPYGDAPGAWRSSRADTRDPRESIHRARGTR